MSAYILRRVTAGAAVIAGLLIFSFLATHYIGDPVAFVVDPELAGPEEEARLREEGGFNRPVLEQLGSYLVNAAQGDFGTSIWQNRPAREIVLERVPARRCAWPRPPYW